jgi:outer membrane protein, heavy metal efflux system
MVKASGAIVLAALIAGCTSAPRESGFAEVQKQVRDRIGQRVQWNRQTPEDREADAAVHNLLAHELTVDQAVQLALLNNPTLQATYEDIGIAQADLVQAELLKNPIFTAAVEIGDGGKGTKLQFSILEDFISILQIPLRRRVAESALAQARLRVVGAAIDVASQTQAAFYSAQASGQMLDLRRTVVQASDASFELARRIHAAGNSNDLDLSTQEAQLEQAKLDLAMAEIQTQRNRERLTSLMGLRSTDWKIAARLPDLPAREAPTTDIEQRAIDHSLDLGLAKSEISTAAQTLGLLKSFSVDGAELGAASEKEVDGTWETGPAVSVPIPIFDTGKAVRAAARSRYARARQRYRAQEIEIRSAARLASAELAAARSRVQQYRQTIIPLRHRITETMQTQYNAMLGGAFGVLDARREEINAGAAYVEAQRDYWLARSHLDALLAGHMNGAP